MSLVKGLHMPGSISLEIEPQSQFQGGYLGENVSAFKACQNHMTSSMPPSSTMLKKPPAYKIHPQYDSDSERKTI